MKKIENLVSIIIPTFNEGKNIEKCINSLLEQSYQSIEIIIVDDRSTDNTKEILLKLSSEKSELKILGQSHLGPALARNKGSKEAKGGILVFMDADMTFDKDFIKELVKPINEGKYKGTFSKNEYISNWQNIWSRCWNYNLDLPPKKMIPDNYPDEGFDFRAILKDEFLRINGFDDIGYTDTWSLSQKLGYKPNLVAGAEYYHNNPDNLREVFTQSKWVSKREYRFGFVGILFALVRSSLPASLLLGLFKVIEHKEIRFIFFKVVYDLGSFLGILEMKFTKKHIK